MIRLLLITMISALAAFFVFRLIERRRPQEGKSAQPRLPVFLVVGLICALLIMFVLPRFGLTAGMLVQKLLGFLPLIRAFLPC